jgi:formylglycine-generating enzyme required for sulfatase activity
MGENPSHFNGDNQSVETVGWDDAQAFIKQLNQIIPHLQTRLPWESEWEYACRAGRQTPFNFADELTLAKVNYRGTWEYKADEWGQGAKRETAEVKSYPCNDWGLYEGNVWEWCEDASQEHLGHEAVQDPWQQSVAAPGAARVVRGGSWNDVGGIVRSAIRDWYWPGIRDFNLGFRLALGHSGSSHEDGARD